LLAAGCCDEESPFDLNDLHGVGTIVRNPISDFQAYDRRQESIRTLILR
jgi:hypothetical protein